MASTSSSSCSLASQFLPPPRKLSVIPFHSTNCTHLSFPAVVTPRQQPLLLFSSTSTCLAAAAASNSNNIWNSNNNNKPASSKEKEVEVEVDEELPWIQEKALDLVEFTGSVTQAIPGPRVGPTSLPWILAIPLTYAGLTFVIAFVKTIRKFSSPKAKRRRQVAPSLIHYSNNLCYQNFVDLPFISRSVKMPRYASRWMIYLKKEEIKLSLMLSSKLRIRSSCTHSIKHYL